jgi:hypothetical protein
MGYCDHIRFQTINVQIRYITIEIKKKAICTGNEGFSFP